MRTREENERERVQERACARESAEREREGEGAQERDNIVRERSIMQGERERGRARESERE